MPLFGPSHLTVLALTVLTAAVLCLAARIRPQGRPPSVIAWTIGGVLVASKLFTLSYAAHLGTLSWQNGLPMHLCDWAFFTALFALGSRRQLVYELTYFWGLAGTLQAVLTPDLNFDFPDPRFITFFVSHCGILVALVYLTLGLGLRPTWKSVATVMAWSQVYLAATALVDLFLPANYGYLCHKPENPSLMDYFGPWPWYILTLEALALVSYTIYYLPFALADFFRKFRRG